MTDFVNQFTRKGHASKQFSAEALYLLQHHHWLGNVRELRNSGRTVGDHDPDGRDPRRGCGPFLGKGDLQSSVPCPAFMGATTPFPSKRPAVASD